MRAGLFLLGGLVLASELAGQAIRAEEEPATTVVTREGLRFNLPADWPVEKRGGIVAPIPIEEYLARKFSALEKRLHEVEQRGAALELKLRVIEEELKQQKAEALRSSESLPAQD